MNSKFRCAGCRGYFPTPAYRTVGLGRVCSDECIQIMRDRTRSAPPVSRSDATTLGRALDRATNEVPERTRAAVFLRDNGRCRRCGRRSGLALHHINYRSEGVDHQAHNLVVLCDVCHDWVHADKTARKPLLLAYVWLLYVERRQVYIRQLERA